MKNSKKYVIKEGVFDWLLKTLVGKDRAAKLKFYKAIANDRQLSKMAKELEQRAAEMEKAMEKSHYNNPLFDKDRWK